MENNIVSVPLWGYGFEMKICNRDTNDGEVSVPLRGYGFEMTLSCHDKTPLSGFRPLAGIWF